MHFRFLRRIAPVFLALWLAMSLMGQQASPQQPRPVAGDPEAQPIAGGNPALPLVHVDNGANSAAAQKAHYVVLVSLDGFRWDYAKRDGAVHLLALGKKGVWAPEGMMPSFPSLTFPNHFTIVTGLYPEHHGLVANSFYDRDEARALRDQRCQGRDRRKLVQRTFRCGAWRRARGCGRRACSGRDRRRRSRATGPPGMRSSTTRRKPAMRWSRRALMMRWRC